jgi:amino acid transporter
MDHEKVAPVDEKAPHDVTQPTVSSADGEYQGEWREQEDFMTRNGLNLKSFQRRPKGGPLIVLDKSMKTRHLHMIAIGGSIGAGFFVGSGASLAKGVSFAMLNS